MTDIEIEKLDRGSIFTKDSASDCNYMIIDVQHGLGVDYIDSDCEIYFKNFKDLKKDYRLVKDSNNKLRKSFLKNIGDHIDYWKSIDADVASIIGRN